MKNLVFLLLLSTACAYPLIENGEIGQEHSPIEFTVDGRSDDQLVPNIEKTQSMMDNDDDDDDADDDLALSPLNKPIELTPSAQPNDLSPLVQPALDLNRNVQTKFNVQNWNGGSVHTGLTIETAYFISDVHCSGTQCSVRLT